VGIYLEFSEWNRIYHNRLIGNTMQAYDSSDTNQWDNGYPSGGNYWSDYAGYDVFSGLNQDTPGSDGLGDTPYVIDSDSIDRYPLMTPFQLIGPISPFPQSAFLTGRDLENVTLMWALSPDDGQGLKSVVRYNIFRDTGYNPEGIGYSFLASVPNGTSVIIDVQTGEGNPNNYYYRVCAVDFGNNTRCSNQQLGKITRPLSKGPNLVSIPIIQSDESLQTVLQTLSYDNAWSYDPINQEWKSFMKSKPYGQGLEYVNHTMGIWVNVTEDSNLTVAGVVPTLTTINLQAGWNLVGFPSFDTNYTVADLKAVVLVERIEGFDAFAPPYFLRVMADGNFLQAGFGYWIRVVTETSWTIGNP
ncbi:MAG: NosD domain-containing protein, partial [Thermoplasmata archaeon]